MKAIDIEWDVDNESELDTLPTEIELPEGMTNIDEISDYISEVTGFCHFGFSLDKTDLHLEISDLLENNEEKGIIKVDKSVFDDFAANTYIYISFVDGEEENAVFEYIMISEDNEGIVMEYSGRAE